MSLKDAKVVSSKFLQLKDKLDKNLRNNKDLYKPGLGNGFTDHTQEMDIKILKEAFEEMCKLLHELVIEENSKGDNIREARDLLTRALEQLYMLGYDSSFTNNEIQELTVDIGNFLEEVE